MTKRSRDSLALLIPAVAMLLAPCAFGQASVSAQLRGVVNDPAGAAVPAATVTVRNEATNTSEKAQTDDFGRYIFNTLRPDSYSVKVEAAGFKTVVHPNVVLRVAQQLDLDFTLEGRGRPRHAGLARRGGLCRELVGNPCGAMGQDGIAAAALRH